jgi:hypothetical protein
MSTLDWHMQTTYHTSFEHGAQKLVFAVGNNAVNTKYTVVMVEAATNFAGSIEWYLANCLNVILGTQFDSILTAQKACQTQARNWRSARTKTFRARGLASVKSASVDTKVVSRHKAKATERLTVRGPAPVVATQRSVVDKQHARGRRPRQAQKKSR